VLRGVQPQEIPFSTSISARISVVKHSNNIKHSNNMKTSCALHVITKYGTIFFISSTVAAVTDHIKKQQ
jgi:hypothetical protein